MGEDARINSVKVELDSNNNKGDYITVKGINVVRVSGIQSDKLDGVVKASDSITIEDITSNPASVSGYINKLPETVDGYKVKWTSSSNQIDLDSREVFHDTTAKKVYLYAEVYDENAQYPYVVRKTFELNVRAATTGEETDKFVAGIKLKSLNTEIDSLSEEQKRYISSCEG